MNLLLMILVIAFANVVHGVDASGKDECATRRYNCLGQAHLTLDGTCNNLPNPTWGATNTILSRLLPPEYDDSIGKPKARGVFRELASPRIVSNALNDLKKSTGSEISHMHALFGQLLAHDFALTPMVKASDGSTLDCNCDNPHKECINIEIPDDDIQRQKSNRKCMPLPRSLAAEGLDGCVFSHREQLNQLSSFIDATFIYGKTDKDARELRDFSSSSGEMKTESNPASARHGNLPNQDQLKGDISKTMQCPIKVHTPKNIPCFVAGDLRANENPALVSLHTIFLRYHNYVARDIKSANAAWDSDKVFNVARRIVSAIYQSITYREYLPPLLGPLWTKRFDLQLMNGFGYWGGYDPRYNPAITNEFTTAAFRYGHSQVAETMTRRNAYFGRGSLSDVKTGGTFFTSDSLLEEDGGGTGAFMRGFIMDSAERTDTTFVNPLRNQLFTEIGKKFGNDLFAVNIQRGRDHGLPGYNKYRELCGMPRVRTFSELSNEFSQDMLNRLRGVYDSVEDIDLYVGGLAEKTVEGGQVGPTFACILSYGFRAMRKGDRYWHENEHSPLPFTRSQLSAIRKTTFASILCQVGEDMRYVTEFPMMKREKGNSFFSCNSVSGLDISPWKHFNRPYPDKIHHDDSKWTTWFITKYIERKSINVNLVAMQLLKERPGEICEAKLGYELRTVHGSKYLQVRFACPIGSIKYTDFPFQISQHHRWSDWITAHFHSHGGDQSIEIVDFNCNKVVAIQAKSGDKFASETGDVFEKFGPESGFLCRDRHQYTGICQRYHVRVLCFIKDGISNVEQPRTIKPTSFYPEPAKTTKHMYPEPPSTTAAPKIAIDRAKSYCRVYNVCCIPPKRHNLIHSSFPVLTYAGNLCRTYGICCNP